MTFDFLRYRECTNPAPSGGGLQCLLHVETNMRDVIEKEGRLCNMGICPNKGIDGQWGMWSAIGPCSRTCGGGFQVIDSSYSIFL